MPRLLGHCKHCNKGVYTYQKYYEKDGSFQHLSCFSRKKDDQFERLMWDADNPRRKPDLPDLSEIPF